MKLLVTLAALAALLTAAPASAGVRELGARGPLGDERLSDERTVTRWAHVAQRGAVRTRAGKDGRTIARLRYWTEDDRPEVYIVLKSRRVARGLWFQIRVPGRPNGRKGWVRASALGPLHAVRTQLVVNRATQHATLYRAGRAIWRAPVGVGAP